MEIKDEKTLKIISLMDNNGWYKRVNRQWITKKMADNFLTRLIYRIVIEYF